MAIEARIVGNINQTHVQLEISPKEGGKRYFIVPEDKADSFIQNYKKSDKKNTIIANSAFMGGIFASILAASALTKNIKKTALKWTLNMAAGIAGAGISIIGTSKYMLNQYDKLLNTHNATEITR